MKRIVLTLLVCIVSAMAFAADKVTEVFTLDHQMSQMCEKKIVTNLRFEKGVTNIQVSLKDNTITITFDPQKTSTEELIAAFKKIGFTAFLCNPEAPVPCPEPVCPAEVAPCGEPVCPVEGAPCCN